MYLHSTPNKHSFMPRGKSTAVAVILLAFAGLATGETREDLEAWSYHREWDKLTNVDYSLARSPLPRRGAYDTLRLELICKNQRLQFALDSYNLITSKGNVFDVDYRVDGNDPVALRMRTYADTKRRGFSDDRVMDIVGDLLSGQSIFIRVHTIIQTVLSAKISLQGAAQPIERVLADCGESLPGRQNQQPDYGMTEFERDLKALAPERQRQVWETIKQLIESLRQPGP